MLLFLGGKKKCPDWKVPLLSLIHSPSFISTPQCTSSCCWKCRGCPGWEDLRWEAEGMERPAGYVSPLGPWATLLPYPDFYPKWEQCYHISKPERLRHICSYLYQFCWGCKIAYAILMKLYLNFITSLRNHVITVWFPSYWAKIIVRCSFFVLFF